MHAPATARLLSALLIAAAASTPALAKPADFATLTADPARSENARKLDDLRQPAEILDFVKLKKGQTVADFYAGGGYFTGFMAQIVGPKGKVIAVNQANFHSAPNWEKVKARFANIEVFTGPADGLHLAPKSVDVFFTHLIWHDLYWVDDKNLHPRLDIQKELAGWFATVKKGGTVIVVDHVGPKGDPRDVVERLHRIDPDQVKADMKAAGFKFVGESKALRNPADDHSLNVFDKAIRGRTDRFMLRFKRP